MVLVANDLRANNSPSYIATELLDQALKTGKNCVIESIRTVGEIEALRKKWAFYLFAIDANPKIRYNRAYSRKSDTDNITLETFIENEKREMESSDPNKQNLSACIGLADYTIENNWEVEELHEKIENILKNFITRDGIVPSWNEYFIEIAKVTAKRSKDPSTQTGCVIVDKNNRPISFWYNGFIWWADEKCFTWERPMKYHFVIHAEMNAIIFAKRDLTGCKLFTKYFPCENCLKHILQAGITEIVYEHAFVESKKNNAINTMNTSDTTLAVARMLLAMPHVTTHNVLTENDYITDTFWSHDNIPQM